MPLRDQRDSFESRDYNLRVDPSLLETRDPMDGLTVTPFGSLLYPRAPQAAPSARPAVAPPAVSQVQPPMKPTVVPPPVACAPPPAAPTPGACEAFACETPACETPACETPACETPVRETPVREATACETPASLTPARETTPRELVGAPSAGRRGAQGSVALLVVGAISVIGIAILLGWMFWGGEAASGPTPLVADVKRGPFDHLVLEQGEIESSSNVEIRCEVKSRNTGGTQILWVVAEGTHAKKGEPLVRLDASAMERERDQQQIVVNTSRAVVIQAENTYEAAKISRQEYLEGTYKQEEQLARSGVFLAEQSLRTAQLSFKSGERLAAKGIVTSLQLEGDQFAVDKARNELDAAQTKLKVLEQYTKPKMLKQFDSDIVSAEAKWESEKSSHALELKKLNDILDQIAKCEIVAPQDGQVVYANVVSSRGGSEFLVEAGANVREGQVIVRLPDPQQMQVKAKVNESRVTLLRAGMPVAVRLDALPDMPLQGVVTRVNQYAEPTSFFSSQVKEYATFIRILDPPPQIRPGLTAEVRILVSHRDDAVQVPVQATFERGGTFYCLTPGVGRKPHQLRPIVVGATNDKFVVVESGIQENEKVVLDPRNHLADVDLPKIDESSKSATTSLPQGELLQKAQAAIGAPAGGGSRASSGGAGGGGPANGGAANGGGAAGGGNPDQMFARLDADGDGKISTEELKAVPEQFRSRLQQADANQDSFLDRDEFARRPRSGGGPAAGGAAPGGGASP